MPDPIAYGPTGYRCGCGKESHSNLTPCQPDAPATAPVPLTPEAVSAILSDPDNPLYPSQIVVFCDECGLERPSDYMVSAEQTSAERLEVARVHLRAEGWQCDRSGDYCPEDRAQNAACQGVGEYGHGLTRTTTHVGCCPASR